jgi:hypothetical protein
MFLEEIILSGFDKVKGMHADPKEFTVSQRVIGQKIYLAPFEHLF